jgi:UDP-N-acetylglucosamine--N-acetylmuramyl-(pentapeptide) pyrophosphoryl-undecaprenol N-acetylglucosamine transferase
VRGLVLLAAGGTGGHLFPAEALALVLAARDWRVHLATDHRVESYGHAFPANEIHYVMSATITRNPLEAASAILKLGAGAVQARALMARIKPSAAIGFGGYPTVPPMLAAAWAKVPTIIHEQNAVFGRANRFLAPRVTRVATSFADVGGAGDISAKLVQTGNPVRPAVLEAAATPYTARNLTDPFRLLVFGGSQGARFFSDLMPATVPLIVPELRARLDIVQQCRPEDMGRVRQAYDLLGIKAELAPFFTDLPRRIASAHLVISRSGASTCTELAVIGRPAVMVPLPHALDQDQKANAQRLADAGGGWLVDQTDLTPARLAGDITRFINEPDRLTRAAAAARSLGRPDAADRLADLVELVAGLKSAPAASRVPA